MHAYPFWLSKHYSMSHLSFKTSKFFWRHAAFAPTGSCWERRRPARTCSREALPITAPGGWKKNDDLGRGQLRWDSHGNERWDSRFMRLFMATCGWLNTSWSPPAPALAGSHAVAAPVRKRNAQIRASQHYRAEQVFDYLKAVGFPDHQFDPKMPHQMCGLALLPLLPNLFSDLI